MKIKQVNPKRSVEAYALLTVLVMTGISIGVYAGLAQWSSSNALVNDRNNVYNSTVAAAEGASEQAMSYMTRDFLNQSFNSGNLDAYRAQVPTNGWASRYQFGDGLGGVNKSYISCGSAAVMTNLNSQFSGLYGMAYACSVRSFAKALGTPYNLAAGVEQDVQLAAIPVFQFAIFYAMDLEINPGPVMKVTGKVHSNANLYTAPVSGLEFMDDVTAVGNIYSNRAPGDATGGSKVAPVFDAAHMDHVSSLTLPIGTNNSPTAVNAILQVPPFGENPQSPTGQERYFNKTDLVITTTPTNVLVQAGYWDNFTTITPDVPGTSNTPPQYSFIKTNATFYDQREGKNTVTTDIDIAALNKWMTNAGASLNSLASFQLGHGLNSVYVVDKRTGAGKLTVVRVSNGQQLSPAGLTVATAQPLYVKGQFNAPLSAQGTTNTASSAPASLLGDSITVLSKNWSDANSVQGLSQRPAIDTTVNAAFLAGIVPTTTISGMGHYSGGVENFPRFLEDWSGRTFTYNGSMVVMFPSQLATSSWVAPGTYYNAPNRRWAFDVNFLDYRKLPPATPMVRKLVRGQWTVLAAQ